MVVGLVYDPIEEALMGTVALTADTFKSTISQDGIVRDAVAHQASA